MIHHPVLDQLAEHGVKLGLDRVRSFLQYAGEPHRAFPVVHVAGTNGKGSVCAYLTAVLGEAGYRVGTYTSPHLEAVNERVQVGGRPLDDASLRDQIESMDRLRWEWAKSQRFEQVPLTYFEFLTLLAFRTFASAGVDVAVIEVGLGGRLDATNVVHPVVCAVTSVSMDHMETLGTTLAEIAAEKAGIFKTGVPVVVGPVADEARQVIAERARASHAELWLPGPHITRSFRGGRWTFTTPEGSIDEVTLGLRGMHQGANAAVAVGVLHQLRRQGFLVPNEAIRAGLAATQLAGRLEEVRPGLLVDGAHNRAGTEALAAYLAERPRPGFRILLWGMGMGREPVQLIEPLLPHVDEVVTTQCAHPKARDPMELAMTLAEHFTEVELAAGGPIEESLPEVYAEADETVVAGSLFLAGAVRSLAREGVLDGIEPGQGPAAPVDEGDDDDLDDDDLDDLDDDVDDDLDD